MTADATDDDVPVTGARIVVNLLWCVPGQVGGSEEYLTRQLIGLGEQPEPRWRPRLAMARGLGAAHPELGGLTQLEAPTASQSRARRILTEATWLRRVTRHADLVHHGGGTAPFGARRPYLLTVHDLQYRTYPEYFSATKRAYLDAVLPRSVRAAALVAVPSDYVKGSVATAYGIDPDRIVVVPHGIEPGLTSNVTPEPELRQRYRLGDGPVLMYPAVTHPHKNHALLLELMARHWHDPDLRLVLTGGRGTAEHTVAGCTDPRVIRTGRVPDADRNGLLAMATAMVFPSSYEGFGAPVIEAMTLGAPVICSDATCLPDIVGDAAVVRPPVAADWADALGEAIARRDALIAAGYRRAAQFSTRASGAALAQAYREALRRG